MALANYRIADLSIQYFKGFTAEQTLSFDGRNVFLFGENGHGKSSIIEAIRWCLFGTSDVEVRNILYEKEVCLACTRFRRHRVRCFYGTGGESWRDEGLHGSSSLRL